MYKYNCNDCIFNTNNKQHFNRHILSERHKQHSNKKELFNRICDICNKRFKGQSGLYQHKLKCCLQNKGTELQKQDIIESVNEIKTMISEIKANQKPTTINNTNNNSINFILNENFTGAKNFIDMIQGIPLLSVYPPTISSSDYVDTIVGMLKNEIDKFPISERPIQCIKDEDENQKILHIRHQDEWYKEKEIDWTTQIHNSSLGDDDAPTETEEKIIFQSIKQMEKQILHKIGVLYGKDVQRDYSYEVDHPANKVRIIKYILEYINIERETLLKIIDETYNKIKIK
jgi:hypothetical protein